jgi:hypothetical protein
LDAWFDPPAGYESLLTLLNSRRLRSPDGTGQRSEGSQKPRHEQEKSEKPSDLSLSAYVREFYIRHGTNETEGATTRPGRFFPGSRA